MLTPICPQQRDLAQLEVESNEGELPIFRDLHMVRLLNHDISWVARRAILGNVAGLRDL